METLVASASIVVHVMPSFVWEAITDNETVQKLLLHDAVTTDWKTGSTIEFVHSGTLVKTYGKVIVANAPHKLAFTYPLTDCEGAADRETVITFELEPVHMKTKVTATQSDFAAFTNAATLLEQKGKQWQESLHKLRNQLEKENPPFPSVGF